MTSTTDLLDITPALLPARLAELAQAVTGSEAAFYAVDIGGTSLVRMAGAPSLPAHLAISFAVGTEFGRGGLRALQEQLAETLPDARVAPLWVRGRATTVLLSAGGTAEALEELAAVAAPAAELAAGYTDVFQRARRTHRASPAAEIQQDMLPPRIARVAGGEIAAGLLPAYDVGGDWFDHCENPDGAFLAVADAVGRGPRAAAISALGMGAVHAARRAGAGLEECCQEADRAMAEFDDGAFLTAVLANWHAPTYTFAWVRCGHPPPLLLRPSGEVLELDGHATHPLGLWSEQGRSFQRNQRRLAPGERILLYSDGMTDRRTDEGGFLGVDELRRLLSEMGGASALEIVSHLERHIRQLSEHDLADDATQLVLAVED